MTLWSSGFIRSHDKLKPLYLHYQRAYGHQTWQDGNLPWWTPACKVTLPFDHVVLWDHVTNWNHYISITTVPMATKLGRMVTYLDGLLSIKSHELLTKLSYRDYFRLKLSPTSGCCPQWLIFFKNLFYQNNCKDAMNTGGSQIRGALFNFFCSEKIPFLYLPDAALSF